MTYKKQYRVEGTHVYKLNADGTAYMFFGHKPISMRLGVWIDRMQQAALLKEDEEFVKNQEKWDCE